MVDWRAPRVISNDRCAVSFNGVCNAARELNGLDHHSDPLPWQRDGTDPVREALASARYNVDVLRDVRPESSSGEDECLRQLLVDSDEEPATPGPSG